MYEFGFLFDCHSYSKFFPMLAVTAQSHTSPLLSLLFTLSSPHYIIALPLINHSYRLQQGWGCEVLAALTPMAVSPTHTPPFNVCFSLSLSVSVSSTGVVSLRGILNRIENQSTLGWAHCSTSILITSGCACPD